MFHIILSLILSLVATGEAVSAPAQRMASSPRLHLIEIRELGFMPPRTLVSPGDTIVWINRDIVPHTVTSLEGIWSPQELDEGQSWEMVVAGDGTYHYFCEFHPEMEGLLAAH